MMKRLILLASLLFTCYSAFAQDIITLKDGTDIQAKILEVTPTEVKFKKLSNPDGPLYTMRKSDILIVRYENGENEVFSESQKQVTLNTDKPIVLGMKYKDYKDIYDTRNYVKMPEDPYTPFWIGFADLFIPGLGNAITGEWGRAAGFFFSNLGLTLLSARQINTAYSYYGTEYKNYTGLYWIFMAARIGMNVWSICDAVNVAKAKNMYNQDLRAQRASLDFNIEPYFAYTPYTSNALRPVAGLSLKINF